MNPTYQPTFTAVAGAPPPAIGVNDIIPYPLNVVQFKSEAEAYLTSQSWPPAMQEVFLKNLPKIAIRFFICDDSGSMGTEDGKTSIAYKGKVR